MNGKRYSKKREDRRRGKKYKQKQKQATDKVGCEVNNAIN